jgi:glutathione S-transferase
MKLYYSPGVCSLSPHILMREAGLTFDLIKVDYASKQLPGGGDYRRLNPLGYVPLLELDNGELLAEGPAIVQYLGDLKPEAGLVPAQGSFARYRLQEWLGFINSELHKPYSALFDSSYPAELKAQIRTKIGQRLDYAVERMNGQAWLVGERFGAADAYLFTVLEWSRFVDIDLSPWPSLQAHVARVRQRPAVRAALQAEGLLK